jgi:hypothetical protein
MSEDATTLSRTIGKSDIRQNNKKNTRNSDARPKHKENRHSAYQIDKPKLRIKSLRLPMRKRDTLYIKYAKCRIFCEAESKISSATLNPKINGYKLQVKKGNVQMAS